MAVTFILPAFSIAVRQDLAEARDRLDRLAAIDPEHKEMALMFLSSYASHIFDDVLDTTEPVTAGPVTGYSLADDAEPYCTVCGASAGVFPALGDGWRHYRGDGITAKAQPYGAGHPPVIGWRLAGDIPAQYWPEVFDAVVEATEPCDDRDPDDEPGMEPFCVTCGDRTGIFLAQCRDWLHYRADAVGNAEPYEAGHEPVIGWRPLDAEALGQVGTIPDGGGSHPCPQEADAPPEGHPWSP
jgi:hypothetical protein